jgi:hypothetical protein
MEVAKQGGDTNADVIQTRAGCNARVGTKRCIVLPVPYWDFMMDRRVRKSGYLLGVLHDVISPCLAEGRTYAPSIPYLCLLEEVPQHGIGF